MTEFHHHPDDIIYVRAAGKTYADTLASFAADAIACGLPAYEGLPEGIRERRYVPGTLHALFTADSQSGALEPWPEGEAYIAGTEALLAAQTQRQADDAS